MRMEKQPNKIWKNKKSYLGYLSQIAFFIDNLFFLQTCACKQTFLNHHPLIFRHKSKIAMIGKLDNSP